MSPYGPGNLITELCFPDTARRQSLMLKTGCFLKKYDDNIQLLLIFVFIIVRMLWCFSMKTVMLFLTIMLVGTGWTFVKHIFSDKEKKLFLVAIPLQVLVYVARVSSDIILEYIHCCWVTAFTTINRIFLTKSCSY